MGVEVVLEAETAQTIHATPNNIPKTFDSTQPSLCSVESTEGHGDKSVKVQLTPTSQTDTETTAAATASEPREMDVESEEKYSEAEMPQVPSEDLTLLRATLSGLLPCGEKKTSRGRNL